jgi:hypothetical protein
MINSYENNDEIKIVIIHIGYKKYLEENLKITSQQNKIILIGDNSLERLGTMNNVIYINIDKYLTYAISNFKKYFINYSSNNVEFEFICFARIFVLEQFMKEYNIKKIFHSDSDNVILININKYIFTKDVAYIINKNYENPYRMSNSIHCALLNIEFCNIFIKLYEDIFINKSKMYLIQDKINFHKREFINGGICDMTFYYLINEYKMLDIQNLALPIKINGIKYVFINNYNNGEGFQSRTQYKLTTNNTIFVKKIGDKSDIYNNYTIYDELNNEELQICNIHFQGTAKKYLEQRVII